jgi:UDP-3-O-[3-hydroxymyristoyl] N-acetylglucosamine deacetylase
MSRFVGNAGGVPQRTLKNSISCNGVGLHSGQRISLTLHPAECDTGIVFKRSDLEPGRSLIPARWDRVVDTFLCTAIGNEHGVRIATIEHLMAALAGCHVDNALIEVDGPEVPAMDGSAAPFVFLIECAGVVEQEAARRAIEVLKPVTVVDSGRTATLSPDDCFRVSCEIEFDTDLIARQSFSVELRNGTFKSEISRARTFGFAHEVDRLRAAGLARGGSMENAVVISDNKVLNEEGLRFDDEFVRHKVLDSIGDLYLAGHPIIGHFRGHRTGHEMNNAVLRALFADESAWCEVVLGAATNVDDSAWRSNVMAISA